MKTYWGESQSVTECKGKDIIVVDFAGHGGVGVKKELAEKHKLNEWTTAYGGYMYGYYWFEEDCDWIIPFYLNPSWTVYLEEELGKDKHEITKMIFDLAKNHHTLKKKAV